MTKLRVRVQEAASRRLDHIYQYTRDQWGDQQAERYISGLFKAFDGLETGRTFSRPFPAEFGIKGCFFRFPRHSPLCRLAKAV